MNKMALNLVLKAKSAKTDITIEFLVENWPKSFLDLIFETLETLFRVRIGLLPLDRFTNKVVPIFQYSITEKNTHAKKEFLTKQKLYFQLFVE